MATSTIRLPTATHRQLKEIAAATGRSMQEALVEAVDDRSRRLYLEQLNADFAALRKDPKAWAEMTAENELWDSTLNDGLDDE